MKRVAQLWTAERDFKSERKGGLKKCGKEREDG
jgi:hypothetical protein